MANLVPRTAISGRSRSSHDLLAKGLGYFSLAIGAAELAMPRTLCRAAGLEEGQETLLRLYGAREVAAGFAILSSHDPTPWIWGRVAGDVLDLATVATGALNAARPKTLLSLAALAGATALDAFCAVGLTGEKAGRKTACADYRDRSGFRNGVESARGLARDFEIPRDMRAPDALRPWSAAEASVSG